MPKFSLHVIDHDEEPVEVPGGDKEYIIRINMQKRY